MARWMAMIAFVLVSAAATQRASANTCADPDGCPWMIFPMSGFVFLVGDVVFIAAEITFARSGEIMPPEWSIPELVFGAATAALGAAMVGAGLESEGTTRDLLYGGAGSAFAFGSWFLGHAIVSLIHHADGRAPPVDVSAGRVRITF